jgi:DNA-binding transcriptional MerR regulator
VITLVAAIGCGSFAWYAVLSGAAAVAGRRVGPFALERTLSPRLVIVTTWSISEAAEKCGLSQHTLRWYERIGLLGPVARDANGRRRFSDGDLEWLDLITRLRETGMPVSDMQRYAELVRSGAGEAERLELLRRHRDEVRRALAAQRECLKLLNSKIDIYSRRVRQAQTG